MLVVFSVWLCHGTKGACLCTACQIWLTCSHLSLKPFPYKGSGGPGHRAPSTTQFFRPSFLHMESLLDCKTRCSAIWGISSRQIVECKSWVSRLLGAQWSEENQIQHRLKEWSENSYLCAEHVQYFAQTESSHIDKSMFAYLLFVGDSIGMGCLCRFPHKSSLCILHWWGCPQAHM